jgi:hypothetical protein
MEGDLSIVFPNGSKIKLFGADNHEALRGLYFDAVVLDEYSQFKPQVWPEVIRPALSDRKGTATFIGTPSGKGNAFYTNYQKAKDNPAWYFLELKASQSGIIPPEELTALKEELDSGEYQQEFECDFNAGTSGSYYGTHMSVLEARGHFTDVPAILSKPVQAAMDIGFSDAASIWFWQYYNGRVNIIDYWENSGYDAEEVVEVLELKPYTLQQLWLPHDAFARTFRSKKSVMDVFMAANLPVRRVPNPDAGNRVLHGINAVRNVLRTWPIYFDKNKCKRGIEALENYSRKWNIENKVFQDNPLHDQWSHGADGFRYVCLSLSRELMQNSITKTDVINIIPSNKFTLNDALAEHKAQILRQKSMGRARI